MNKNDFDIKKNNLFALIESWDETNILLAIELLRAHKTLRDAAANGYREFLNFVGRGSLFFEKIARTL